MSEVQTLARGLRILDIMGHSHDSVGITQLSKELAIDKSSVSRLVSTLVKYHFAEREPKTRRYRLGLKIRQLNQQMDRLRGLHEQAKPFLYELVSKTGENAELGIYTQNGTLVIAVVESSAMLRVVSQVGQILPLHCTAMGKCLLASSDIAIPEPLPQLTANTITAHEELRRHLEQIRAAGIAVDNEEHTIGVRSLAAPVVDYSGQPIAAIGISGPTVRLTPQTLSDMIEMVRQVAAALCKSLP